jgi:fimbrial chaperone protein
MRMFFIHPVFVFVMSFFSPLAIANAMSVEPMVLDLASVGKQSTASLKVSNPSVSPLPVEINISRMEIGKDGQPIYKPAAEDFLIYPPQANIPAGAAQTFRIQWIGSPELAKSATYRFSVSQIPLRMAKGQSGIQVTMSFGVVVSVSPLQAKAAVSVGSATAAKDKDGKSAVALNVKNAGNKQAYMRRAGLRLSAGNWSTKLSAYEVEQKVGLGIVQPGKERIFLIPLDVPPGVTQISATLDYQPEE